MYCGYAIEGVQAGSNVARIQSQINHAEAYRYGMNNENYQNGLQHFSLVHNIFIPNDFAWMLSTAEVGNEYNFITLAEFFNSQENEDPYGDNAFRIGIELHKAIGDQFFTFALEGDVRTLDPNGSGGWIWNSEDTPNSYVYNSGVKIFGAGWRCSSQNQRSY